MRRQLASRALGLATAAWFAALATELPALHSCPVHDEAAMGAHMHAASVAQDHAAAGRHEAPSHSNSECTCVGTGCCSAATTLPASLTTGIAAAIVVHFSAPPVDRASPRPLAPEFLLPPAIGPPVLPTGQLT